MKTCAWSNDTGLKQVCNAAVRRPRSATIDLYDDCRIRDLDVSGYFFCIHQSEHCCFVRPENCPFVSGGILAPDKRVACAPGVNVATVFMKRLLFIAMLLIAARVARAQGSTPVADIDASKERAPISPYVYGQFIEHAGNLSYTALWCEMLDDWKFYYAVMPKPADEPSPARGGMGGFGGRRRGVGPGRWNPIGPVDSVMMGRRPRWVVRGS
jgi:hypothetical protein